MLSSLRQTLSRPQFTRQIIPINTYNTRIITTTIHKFQQQHQQTQNASTQHKPPVKTAIVMLNMGGPTDPSETEYFLTELFTDPEIIPMGPLQPYLGPYIARRRTPKITEQYKMIGGSPIKKWTDIQGREMCRKLDELSPSTAPHKHYICFRYAAPQTEQCINEMLADGVTRAIAFSQYPQFSCTTTGSSYNHLWRELKRLQHERTFQWSVIDRWLHNNKFINSVVKRIEQGLQKLKSKNVADEDVLILFSAHSLPVKVITRGDAYCHEVHSTVELVMQKLTYKYKHLLSWQSKVGYLPWLTPSTADTITGLGKQGYKNILIVPIAFTSDHVETLFEIDMEYKELAHESGITNFVRTEGLNDLPELSDALADIVHSHLATNEVSTPQYQMNCIQCINPDCRRIVNPIKPYSNMRTKHQKMKIIPQNVPNTYVNENMQAPVGQSAEQLGALSDQVFRQTPSSKNARL